HGGEPRQDAAGRGRPVAVHRGDVPARRGPRHRPGRPGAGLAGADRPDPRAGHAHRARHPPHGRLDGRRGPPGTPHRAPRPTARRDAEPALQPTGGGMVSVTPREAELLDIAGSVPDPELPVRSLRELGVARAVHARGTDAVEVELTPTYTGCPAIEAMSLDI